MVIRVGIETISDVQLDQLGRCRSARSLRTVAQLLDRVVRDRDILDGDEDLHPHWISIFKRYREQLQDPQVFMRRESFENLCRVFDSLEPIDSSIRKIDPEQEQIVLLLGAGASKPSPSDIPTVTELLPELLSRARRLDREQVTSLGCVDILPQPDERASELKESEVSSVQFVKPGEYPAKVLDLVDEALDQMALSV